MSANSIIYCLQQLTDYQQFERLASDLMAASGFPEIEPLGGTGDGGRDALHSCHLNDTTTIFAYSVRSDWDSKLRSDCARIDELQHNSDNIVFVSTQYISAKRKDELREFVRTHYGWGLEFYDLERIRLMLTGPQKEIIEHHPSIFCPPWFQRRGGVFIGQEQHDLIVIDHVGADHALASWLYRKLSLSGYATWCFGLAPLAGENADESVRTLINTRAVKYLPILSPSALQAFDFRSRWAINLGVEKRTLPCWASSFDVKALDSQMAALQPLRFDRTWSQGLQALFDSLENDGVLKKVDPAVGTRIALDAYMPEPLLRPEPETVYANVFSTHAPEALIVHQLVDDHAVLDPNLRMHWAHSRRGSLLFSFESPPDTVPIETGRPHQYAWRLIPEQYGLNSRNIAKELVRKSLHVACFRAGFKWCDERQTFYLDEPARKRHRFQHVDGRYTHVSFTGDRSWGTAERRRPFKYQLGPQFRVGFDDAGDVWITVRFYVRLTDDKGVPLDVKLIPSRRKRVTKGWWNKEWFQRTLGVMQFVSGEGPGIDRQIVIGSGPHCLSVDVMPLHWDCPVGIDVEALDRIGDFQQELSEVRGAAGDDAFPEGETDG